MGKALAREDLRLIHRNTMLMAGSQAVLIEIARINALEYFESPTAGRITSKDFEIRWHHVGEYRYEIKVITKKQYLQSITLHIERAQKTDVFAYILQTIARWRKIRERRNKYNSMRQLMA